MSVRCDVADCKHPALASKGAPLRCYGNLDLPVIAYLTSEYPALSHTFIRREIAALRARGLDVRPFSVRLGRIAWDEAVPSILGRGKLRVGLDALAALVTRPGAALRTLILTQSHRDKGLRGWLWSLFHFVEALSLARMLNAVGAERLHSHFANSGATVGLLAAHYLGIPWSLTLHGISEVDPPAGSLLPDCSASVIPSCSAARNSSCVFT